MTENLGTKKSDNVVLQYWNRFFPYWPLLAGLALTGLVLAWLYLKITPPTYQANASLLIKDQNKGSDDPKLSESLDFLSAKKSVENEIEVLQSKSVIRQAVLNNHLYASVRDKNDNDVEPGRAPFKIESKNPDQLAEQEDIKFVYDPARKVVTLGLNSFPVNSWAKTEYGELRFVPGMVAGTEPRELYFSLSRPKKVIAQIQEDLAVSSVSKVSSVVNLSIKDKDPQRAESILRGVLTAYNTIQLEEKDDVANTTTNFVEERLKAVKHDIDSIEKQVQLYKAANKASTLR